jgi:hypothetical protein
MEMRNHILAVTIAMVFVLAMATVAVAANPFVGTWKLNVAKSKFSKTGPKEWTDVYREIEGDTIEVTVNIVMSDGSSDKEKIVSPRQGGVATFLQGGNGRYEVETFITPSESYSTTMTNGKQTGFMHLVVSKDGKTMRYTIKGPDGPFEGEAVFDKQ